ncbi:CYFA0S13e01442g1_1 [Cyberlindnera fabianii]|uniref:DASH complex subunit DAM1 n=1 Tax=Cyberlindnera fabianii TaxID=36022 RepID=A0A061B290_CYBFA|nr:CYFA0S13e01442g1_1 [Cyberlindnera fabianii]
MSRKNSRSSTPHRLSRPSNVIPSPGLHYEIDTNQTPMDQFIPQFSELSDNLVDLDSNVQRIQSIHESLNSFNESFGSFLYGLQINAYTVEFNEIPTFNNFKQDEIREKIRKLEEHFKEQERAMDDTYMTNDEDGSFVVEPTTSKGRQSRQSIAPRAQPRQQMKTSQPPSLNKTGSKIPVVGRRVTGGVMKPTKASEGRQNTPVQKDSRPPFR